MAHHKDAIKRIRTSAAARARNRALRSRLRSTIKSVRTAESVEEAQKMLGRAVSVLDRMAGKGIIHANKAARGKSRLTRFVKAMETA